MLSGYVIDIQELVRLLHARLAATQAVNGYRGGQAREVPVRELLESASSARPFWQRVFQPLTDTGLIEALIADELKDVARASRFDLTDVRAFYDGGIAEARRRRHIESFCEHALFVAFGRKSLRAPLEAAGVDVSEVCTALDRLLRTSFGPIAALPTYARLVGLACAQANTSKMPISIEPLVVMMLRNRSLARALAACKVDSLEVIYALAHGRRSGQDVGLRGEVDVVFYNDVYTTMAFVVKVLSSVFEVPEQEARALMMHVHLDGSARIGPFAADDARERLARVDAMATPEGMPLRIELAARAP